MNLRICVFICICLANCMSAQAQEITEEEEAYSSLINHRFKDLDRYLDRVQRKQDKLLKRLARQEKRVIHSLKKRDTSFSTNSLAGTTSFDSLRIDPKKARRKSSFRFSDPAVDSLRKLVQFVQTRGSQNGDLSVTQNPALEQNVDELSSQLSDWKSVNSKIAPRIQALKSASKSSIPGLSALEKKGFYAQSRFKAWRDIADNPSKIEAKSLELLQGTPSFAEAFSKASSNDRSNGAMSANPAASQPNTASPTTDDLEKMGYQTKKQLSGFLQGQFGDKLGGTQAELSKQVDAWQENIQNVSTSIEEGKSLSKNIRKPTNLDFKINPMRGLPFRERITKGYSLQTNRATSQNPALLNLAGEIAFKHTPALSYGLGAVVSTGLGQGWNQIHITLQGVGGRAFTQWKWKYGLGAYGGYERIYRTVLWGSKESEKSVVEKPHINNQWQESLLVGVSKDYKINNKWNGSIQLLFDLWWREKSLPSPIQFRISTFK